MINVECEWSEVFSGRGVIRRGSIDYFITRLPDQIVPPCLRTVGIENRYIWPQIPMRHEMRWMLKRYSDLDLQKESAAESILTFVYEAFKNAMEHGMHRYGSMIGRDVFPSLVLDKTTPQRLRATIQDRGLGLYVHNDLKYPERSGRQYPKPDNIWDGWGLSKIKRAAGDTLKIEIDDVGMAISAEFKLD